MIVLTTFYDGNAVWAHQYELRPCSLDRPSIRSTAIPAGLFCVVIFCPNEKYAFQTERKRHIMADKLREARRRRILENSEKRMQKILGLTEHRGPELVTLKFKTFNLLSIIE